MKLKALAAVVAATATFMASAQNNPFFSEFTGEHGTPLFSQIKNEHYIPAIDRGIDLANKEIAAIVANSEAPTFENTIVALEKSGKDLSRVLGIYFALLECNSDDEMMEMSMEISSKLSDYSTSIILNEPLWKRVRAVWEGRDKLNLTPEQQMLLKNTYESFALSGANLEGADRDEYKRLSSELSQLTTMFGQNVQKELPTYEIWLTKDDLAGLPESQVEAAALEAEKKGRKGEYLFTLDAPVYMAFMKYSARPDLREKMWRLYTGRNTKGEFSNVDNIKKIADVRRRIALSLIHI